MGDFVLSGNSSVKFREIRKLRAFFPSRLLAQLCSGDRRRYRLADKGRRKVTARNL